MKWIKNRPWKKWRTRKITFLFALVSFVAYVIVCIIMLSNELLLDSTLTTEVLGFLKWVVTTGCVLVIADKTTSCVKDIKSNHVEIDESEDE